MSNKGLPTLLAVPLAILLSLLLLVTPARARAAIVVTTTSPAAAADGLCSLIEAIENANADSGLHPDCAAGSGVDTITLAAGATYLLTAVHNITDDGNGLPVVSSQMVIDGQGAEIVRELGSPSFRLFYVGPGGSLTLNRVTVRGGAVNLAGPGLGGGGIYSAGTLHLVDATVQNNQSGGNGGGISLQGGMTSLTNSTVQQNSAAAAGGGIRNRNGTLRITDSTIQNNQSTNDDDSSMGGGISNEAVFVDATLEMTGTLVAGNSVNGLGGGGINNLAASNSTASTTIVRSTIRDNLAPGVDHTEGLGGGIQSSFFRGSGNATASLTITGSTISGNQAVNGGGISSAIDFSNNLTTRLRMTQSTVSGNVAEGNEFTVGNGGGVYIVNGDAEISNSTLSGNQANGSGNLSAVGGGLASFGLSAPSQVTLVNTTLQNNSAAGAGGALANISVNFPAVLEVANSAIGSNPAPGSLACFNLGGLLTSLGNNLDQGTSCPFTLPTDLPGTNPALAPLLNSGGPTATHRPLPGSPLLNSADPGRCAAAPVSGVDQRGVTRPQGVGCDIGAVEQAWAATSLRMSVAHWLNNGTSGTSTHYFLADGTFINALGQQGVWATGNAVHYFAFNPGTTGTCDALSVGRYLSPTTIVGPRFCRDGSGVRGIWRGTLLP